jgi:CBS-domain-containing membrane protein
MSDEQVAEMLRRNFARRINHIARSDVVHHLPDTEITTLLRSSAQNDQAVVPICDDAGRLKGYCISNALLAGLDQSLTALAAKAGEAAKADEAAEPEERTDG